MRKHESYGCIAVTRCTAGAKGIPLFGSRIPHQHYLTLEIREAEYRRGELTRHSVGDVIARVCLSQTQWAELVCSLGLYEGVPCTLVKAALGEWRASCPDQASLDVTSEHYVQTNVEHFAGIAKDTLKELRQLAEQPTISKKRLKDLISQLEEADRRIDDHVDYSLLLYKEETEKIRHGLQMEIAARLEQTQASFDALPGT